MSNKLKNKRRTEHALHKKPLKLLLKLTAGKYIRLPEENTVTDNSNTENNHKKHKKTIKEKLKRLALKEKKLSDTCISQSEPVQRNACTVCNEVEICPKYHLLKPITQQRSRGEDYALMRNIQIHYAAEANIAFDIFENANPILIPPCEKTVTIEYEMNQATVSAPQVDTPIQLKELTNMQFVQILYKYTFICNRFYKALIQLYRDLLPPLSSQEAISITKNLWIKQLAIFGTYIYNILTKSRIKDFNAAFVIDELSRQLAPFQITANDIGFIISNVFNAIPGEKQPSIITYAMAFQRIQSEQLCSSVVPQTVPTPLAKTPICPNRPIIHAMEQRFGTTSNAACGSSAVYPQQPAQMQARQTTNEWMQRTGRNEPQATTVLKDMLNQRTLPAQQQSGQFQQIAQQPQQTLTQQQQQQHQPPGYLQAMQQIQPPMVIGQYQQAQQYQMQQQQMQQQTNQQQMKSTGKKRGPKARRQSQPPQQQPSTAQHYLNSVGQQQHQQQVYLNHPEQLAQQEAQQKQLYFQAQQQITQHQQQLVYQGQNPLLQQHSQQQQLGQNPAYQQQTTQNQQQQLVYQGRNPAQPRPILPKPQQAQYGYQDQQQSQLYANGSQLFAGQQQQQLMLQKQQAAQYNYKGPTLHDHNLYLQQLQNTQFVEQQKQQQSLLIQHPQQQPQQQQPEINKYETLLLRKQRLLLEFQKQQHQQQQQQLLLQAQVPQIPTTISENQNLIIPNVSLPELPVNMSIRDPKETENCSEIPTDGKKLNAENSYNYNVNEIERLVQNAPYAHLLVTAKTTETNQIIDFESLKESAQGMKRKASICMEQSIPDPKIPAIDYNLPTTITQTDNQQLIDCNNLNQLPDLTTKPNETNRNQLEFDMTEMKTGQKSKDCAMEMETDSGCGSIVTSPISITSDNVNKTNANRQSIDDLLPSIPITVNEFTKDQTVEKSKVEELKTEPGYDDAPASNASTSVLEHHEKNSKNPNNQESIMAIIDLCDDDFLFKRENATPLAQDTKEQFPIPKAEEGNEADGKPQKVEDTDEPQGYKTDEARDYSLKPDLYKDRKCMCGKVATLLCVCTNRIYCSVDCQSEDWKVHQHEHQCETM